MPSLLVTQQGCKIISPLQVHVVLQLQMSCVFRVSTDIPAFLVGWPRFWGEMSEGFPVSTRVLGSFGFQIQKGAIWNRTLSRPGRKRDVSRSARIAEPKARPRGGGGIRCRGGTWCGAVGKYPGKVGLSHPSAQAGVLSERGSIASDGRISNPAKTEVGFPHFEEKSSRSILVVSKPQTVDGPALDHDPNTDYPVITRAVPILDAAPRGRGTDAGRGCVGFNTVWRFLHTGSCLQAQHSRDLTWLPAHLQLAPGVPGHLIERLLLERRRHGSSLAHNEQRKLGREVDFRARWQVVTINH